MTSLITKRRQELNKAAARATLTILSKALIHRLAQLQIVHVKEVAAVHGSNGRPFALSAYISIISADMAMRIDR
jgi:hypothetical protein